MFGGFFNKMYYGDPKKGDLKKEDVQISRIKLIFTIIQIRFWQLIQLNLLYSVFWIPVFFLVQTQLLMMQETEEPLSLVFFIILIPFLVLLGPATAGTTYVIRNWARDEHAWVMSHFKDAWKQNWKESMLIMLINGVMMMIFYVNMQFYSSLVSDKFIYILLYYFMLLIALIYIMMNMFIFPMLVTYKLSIKQVFKNAFLFAMFKLPLNLGVLILAGGFFILTASFLMFLPVFLIGFSFPFLIIISYTNWLFDKYLNNQPDDSAEE